MSASPKRMTTVEVLRAAQRLIEDPKHWCQRADARDENGVSCDYDGERAVSRCVMGALCATGVPLSENPACAALCRAIDATGLARLVHFNDSCSHAEVLAAFDRAIENEQAREGEWSVASDPESVPVAGGTRTA